MEASKHMLKSISLALAFTAIAATASAQAKVTTADFAGTWNIEVMSHQIALVIEPAEGNKVTATMMMMGRDTLLKALEQHLPRGAKWTKPTSGMFVWVELPEGADTTALLARALETERVAYLPGQAFAVAGGRSAAHCMRLNFSNCEPARIEEAVARLGRVLGAAQG